LNEDAQIIASNYIKYKENEPLLERNKSLGTQEQESEYGEGKGKGKNIRKDSDAEVTSLISRRM
jgi:hypothetical protein